MLSKLTWTISHMWNNERFYQFNWILTQARITSIMNLCTRIISTIMLFLWCLIIAFQKLSNKCSYKFSSILQLKQNKRMSAIMIFYGAMLLPFNNCPMNVLINSVETEVTSIRYLHMCIISTIFNLVLINVPSFLKNIPLLVMFPLDSFPCIPCSIKQSVFLYF